MTTAGRPLRRTSHIAAVQMHEMLTGAPGSQSRTEELGEFWPYLPLLREFIAKRTSADEIEDIVQESLIRIWSRKGATPIKHPKSYLVRVARAVIIDHSRSDRVRHRNHHCELEDRHHPSDPLSPCRILLGREELEIFMERFNRLPLRTRDILTAIRVDGHSFKSVAEKYGVTISAIEKQVAGALQVLAKSLTQNN